MAASIATSPVNPVTGDSVTFTGDGWTPHATVDIKVAQAGFETELVADTEGAIGSADLADRAKVTLTLSGNASAAETVTLGAVTYTFRASVASTANEVLVGANAAESLANLKAAVNNDTTQSTKYGTATVANPTVGAAALTATTLEFYAKTGGTGGNSLASTETMTNGAFSAATLTGGSAATGVDSVIWHPTSPGTYTITGSDGTLTATATCRVWQD